MRRKDDTSQSLLVAEQLANYYFVRKCFFYFINRMRRRVHLSKNIRRATLTQELRNKLMLPLIWNRKQKLYLKYWCSKHRVKRSRMKSALRAMVISAKMRKVLKALVMRYLITAFQRWRRRAKWPLAERLFQIHTVKKALNQLEENRSGSKHNRLTCRKAMGYRKYKIYKRFVFHMVLNVYWSQSLFRGGRQFHLLTLRHSLRQMLRRAEEGRLHSERMCVAKACKRSRCRQIAISAWIDYMNRSDSAAMRAYQADRHLSRKWLRVFHRRRTQRDISHDIASIHLFLKRTFRGFSIWTKFHFSCRRIEGGFSRGKLHFAHVMTRKFMKRVTSQVHQLCSLKNASSFYYGRRFSMYLGFLKLYSHLVKRFRSLTLTLTFTLTLTLTITITITLN